MRTLLQQRAATAHLALLLTALGGLTASCGWPLRSAYISDMHGTVAPLVGFEDVRAVDGFPSPVFQASFDATIASLAASPLPEDGRRDFPMLVLSSGGVNGAFGAGVLTAWTQRGDRPDFWTVTGVSVGALMAPFVFAGPSFDDRLERLFRRLEPGDLHHEKGVLSSVLFDESLMDNRPLRGSIAEGVDHDLMRAVAARHAEGRRCLVGSTNLDVGDFVIWDLGAIASRGTDEALELFRSVLLASASIPVVYPPVRFVPGGGGRDELHGDGAVMRPLFLPQNVFDGYASAQKAGISWDDVDATLYVIHNGALRPSPVDVQRETLAIATRTVTMMSYTMVADHVLNLYMLSRVWGAKFQFMTMPDGMDLAMDDFSAEDTNRLFLLGQGLIQQREEWSTSPPGFLVNADFERVTIEAPKATQRLPQAAEEPSIQERILRIEDELRGLRSALSKERGGGQSR